MEISESKIADLLQKEDIEGYIELGAPGDEYFSEAEHIAAALSALEQHQLTEENILGIISVAWAKNFNLSGSDMELRLPAIQRVTKYILNN